MYVYVYTLYPFSLSHVRFFSLYNYLSRERARTRWPSSASAAVVNVSWESSPESHLKNVDIQRWVPKKLTKQNEWKSDDIKCVCTLCAFVRARIISVVYFIRLLFSLLFYFIYDFYFFCISLICCILMAIFKLRSKQRCVETTTEIYSGPAECFMLMIISRRTHMVRAMFRSSITTTCCHVEQRQFNMDSRSLFPSSSSYTPQASNFPSTVVVWSCGNNNKYDIFGVRVYEWSQRNASV